MTTEETLHRVEQLTTEVFGHGAAVSVDETDNNRFIVRCWDRKGLVVEETSVRQSRSAALSAMLIELRLKKASAPDEEVVDD